MPYDIQFEMVWRYRGGIITKDTSKYDQADNKQNTKPLLCEGNQPSVGGCERNPPRKRFHEMTSHENDVANYRLRGQGQFRRSLGLLRVIGNITVIMPLGQELFAEIKKYMLAFSTVSIHWYDGIKIPTHGREGPIFHFYKSVSLMAVDVLATQGARASTAMALTQFSRNIPAPAPED